MHSDLFDFWQEPELPGREAGSPSPRLSPSPRPSPGGLLTAEQQLDQLKVDYILDAPPKRHAKFRTTFKRRSVRGKEAAKNRTQMPSLNMEQRLQTVVQSVVGHLDLICNAVCENPLECLIERDCGEGGPVYRMYALHPWKFLLASRSQGGFSDYAISTNPRLIGTDNKYFVGRLTANLFATEWTLRDAGYVYTGTHYIDSRRQELAQISYRANLFGWGGPRQFQVAVPAPGLQCEDIGALAGQEGALVRYASRKEGPPLELPLRPRDVALDEAHPKNFVLENPQELGLVCSKLAQGEDRFYVRVWHSLSPLQAFAICLSNFDRKLFVE